MATLTLGALNSAPLLAPTEYEYLRNILFEFMVSSGPAAGCHVNHRPRPCRWAAIGARC